jgi:hypothetical protein
MFSAATRLTKLFALLMLASTAEAQWSRAPLSGFCMVPTTSGTVSMPMDMGMWYKPAGITHDGSNNITAWSDSSGHGNNLASRSGFNYAAYVAGYLNGSAIARFTASSKMQGSYLGGTNGIGGNHYTIYVVEEWRHADRTYTIDCAFSFGNEPNGASFGDGSTGSTVYFTIPLNTWFLRTLHFDGTHRNVFTNDTYEGQASVSGAVPGCFEMGSWNFDYSGGSITAFNTIPEYFGDVDIAEMIVFYRDLTTAEDAAVKAYLSGEYAISF